MAPAHTIGQKAENVARQKQRIPSLGRLVGWAWRCAGHRPCMRHDDDGRERRGPHTGQIGREPQGVPAELSAETSGSRRTVLRHTKPHASRRARSDT
jgi:hypothetical protein